MRIPMTKAGSTNDSRRKFLKPAAGTAAAIGFSAIVPSSVLGQYAPSKRINAGAIGVAYDSNSLK